MMNLARFTVVLVAMLGDPWFACTALGQNTDTADLTAAAALEKARQALSAFSSIEYEFRMEGTWPRPTSNESKRSEWGRFEYADGKSRSEFTIDSDEYKGNGITAFDGKEYQRSRDGQLRPSIATEDQHPYVLVQPIMYPFLSWLVRRDPTKQPRLDLETYSAPDFWTATKEAAILDGRREVDGHPCAVVKLERKVAAIRKVAATIVNLEVCLALDLDYYPILITMDSGPDGTRGTTRIVEIADLKTSKGRVIVPIRIETKSRQASGNQTSYNLTIDKQTLKVNEPIDSQRFDLRQ